MKQVIYLDAGRFDLGISYDIAENFPLPVQFFLSYLRAENLSLYFPMFLLLFLQS